jgi:hypothetical protein
LRSCQDSLFDESFARSFTKGQGANVPHGCHGPRLLSTPGTDVVILKIFSPIFFAKKWRILLKLQLVFEKNRCFRQFFANFLEKKCRILLKQQLVYEKKSIITMGCAFFAKNGKNCRKF